MLDPKIIRDDPERIKKMLKNRGVSFDFDKLIQLDKQRRELIVKTDDLRKKRNEVSLEVGKKKKAGQDATSLIKEMALVSKELAELETLQNNTELDYTKLALTIPNLIHESVPIGNDATANKELRK
jgi:seryl-tRNA synthetase